MSEISILVPHFHNLIGDRVLAATLPHLIKKTTLPYELIVTAHRQREFIAWNDMAYRARTNWLVLMVSDVFVAPGWDLALWDARDRDTLATLTLIESGYLEPADFSLARDFGRTPETFDADGFEAYAATCPEPPQRPAWNFPWLIHKDTFLRMGSFRLDQLDSQMTEHYYFNDWQAVGRKVTRVQGYGYHLGAWTLTGEKR
jgi:hypothetical protein